MAGDDTKAMRKWGLAAFAILAAVIGGLGSIPLFGGYSVWGMLRLLITTNWKY